MSKKFSERRRRAFVRALEETGNLTLAAEKAAVSRSWVRLTRSRDGGFDAACRAAIAAAKERLSASSDQHTPHPPTADAAGPSLSLKGRGDNAPPSGWGFLGGAELVVSGSTGRRVQVRRARARQWTARVEQRFLQALATSCNVKAACAEVGMTHGSAYAHRKRWPAFERAWDEAVETGYAHLESALLERGLHLSSGGEIAVPGPLGDMTAAQAIHLLHMHKHHVHGVGKGPAPRLRNPLPEATVRLEQAMRAVARESLKKDDGNDKSWAEAVLNLC